MDQTKKQLSFGKLLFLVFTPAVLLLGAYIASLGLRETVPPYLSFLVLALVVLAPAELAVIMHYSKKEHGKYNLKSAFGNHSPLPLKKILLYSVVPFVLAAAVFMVVAPYENDFLLSTLFKNVPDYFLLKNFQATLANYPKGINVIAFVLFLVANGILVPIVEELYFRGFLMSRVQRFGKWAPLLITVLFSLYHLFSPWENVTRILAVYPLTYTVWKRNNIYIGMVLHCCLNTASALMTIPLFFGR